MTLFQRDGSIVLSTKVDTSGIKKGIKSIEKNSDKTSATIKKDIDGISNKVKQLGQAMAAAFSVKVLVDFSKKASDAALQTEASVQRIIGIYGTASDVVGNFIDSNAQVLGMAKSAATDIAATYGNIFNTFADQKTNANLTADYLRMTAVVASKTGRTIDDVQDRIRSGLLGNTEAIEDLGIFVNVSTIEMTNAFKKYANNRAWAQLDAKTQNQIRAIAILEQSTKQYGNEIAKTSMLAKTSLASAWEDFKNTWGKAVNTVLVPIMERLTVIIDAATRLLKLWTNDTEGILGNTEITAEKTENIVDNQKELNSELEQTNELTQRILAGFDDIQKLGGDKENTTSGNMDAFKYVSEAENADNSEYNKKIEATMSALQEVIRWLPTALIAIGILLMGFGRIGLGIGFLIAGAKLYDITEQQYEDEDLTKEIKKIKDEVENNMGKLLIGIGIILCAFGNYPLGLGALVVGLFWDDIKEIIDNSNGKSLSEKLHEIAELLTPLLMGMGILLIFVGIVAVCAGQLKGIGFIVAGAAEIALAYKSDPTAAQRWLEDHVPDIATIGGMVLLVAGLVIALAGKPVIGSAMMAVGAGGTIWGMQNSNGNEVATWLKDKVAEYADTIRAIGSIAAIIGCVLILTGHPLAGAAVLINGIASLGIAGVVSDVKDISNEEIIKKYGYSPEETEKIEIAKKLESGLGVSINGSSNDDIISWLKRLFGRGSSGGIGGKFTIPKYAAGTVIPPNTAHLAIIGDQKKGYNIETPLDTMISAFNTALDSRGAGEPVHVHLYLDGKEIYDNVVNRNRANTRITGVNELAY